jgi:hypothetical protein
VLHDVRYMPRARRNLISLGELRGNAYVYHVDRDKLTMRVKRDTKLMLKGGRTSNNLCKVHVCIVLGGAGEEEAVGSAWADESDESSSTGSCK